MPVTKTSKSTIQLQILNSTKYTKWMKHFPQQNIFYICRKIVLCLDVYWQHSMDRSIFLLNGMVGNRCWRHGWHTPSGKNHSVISYLYNLVAKLIQILEKLFNAITFNNILGYGIDILGRWNIGSRFNHQCFSC